MFCSSCSNRLGCLCVCPCNVKSNNPCAPPFLYAFFFRVFCSHTLYTFICSCNRDNIKKRKIISILLANGRYLIVILCSTSGNHCARMKAIKLCHFLWLFNAFIYNFLTRDTHSLRLSHSQYIQRLEVGCGMYCNASDS